MFNTFFRLFFVCFSVLISSNIWAELPSENQNDYLKYLQEKAQENKLSQNPTWLKLLHIPDFEKQESIAEAKWFFADRSNGKTNPSAELNATLAAFFSTEIQQPRNETTQCQWRARYIWLKEKLAFDPNKLPEQACEPYTKWREGLGDKKLAVVFPAAYINSPASMFGHTLLRVDDKYANDNNYLNKQDGSALLAYAINFAAETNTSNGLAFAYKGLMGGYDGLFSVLPYYEKIKEYERLESRDLWEYPLNLSAQELNMIFAHLWELKGVNFKYYYFDNNCSYQLLSLLQIAREEWFFTQNFEKWAIPADTVKLLTEIPNLAGKPNYRPALETQLRAKLNALTTQESQWVMGLASGKLSLADFNQEIKANNIKPQDHAHILTMAQDWLHFQFMSGKLSRENSAERLRQLLIARSQLNESPKEQAINSNNNPMNAHASSRIGAGIQSNTKNGLALTLQYRPAYHDYLDNPNGFNQDSTVNFVNTQVSIYTNTQTNQTKLKLDYLNLVDVSSRAGFNRFFAPTAWEFKTGFRSLYLRGENEKARIGFFAEGGGGIAYDFTHKLKGIASIGTGVEIHGNLAHDVAVPLELKFGLFANISPKWRAELNASAIPDLYGEQLRYRVNLAQQWDINHNSALRFELDQLWFARQNHFWNADSNGFEKRLQGQLSFLRYF